MQLLIFLVQRRAVAGEGSGSRLGGQGLHTVEQVRDVVEAAVDNLELAQTVVGVRHTLLQLGDVAAEAVRDREAGSIVTALVDAVAGGQLLNGFALESGVRPQVHLRVERINVSTDGNHCLLSLI